MAASPSAAYWLDQLRKADAAVSDAKLVLMAAKARRSTCVSALKHFVKGQAAAHLRRGAPKILILKDTLNTHVFANIDRATTPISRHCIFEHIVCVPNRMISQRGVAHCRVSK